MNFSNFQLKQIECADYLLVLNRSLRTTITRTRDFLYSKCIWEKDFTEMFRNLLKIVIPQNALFKNVLKFSS